MDRARMMERLAWGLMALLGAIICWVWNDTHSALMRVGDECRNATYVNGVQDERIGETIRKLDKMDHKIDILLERSRQ